MSIIDFMKDYQVLICLAINFLAALAVFIARKEFVTSDEHEKLKTRVTTIESAITGLPSASEMRSLSEKILRLEGTLQVIDMRFKHVDHLDERLQLQIDRMIEFLNRKGAA